MKIGKSRLFVFQSLEQLIQSLALLKIPQTFGIGRGNVYRHVVRDAVYGAQAGKVILPGVIVIGRGITTEIDADDSLLAVLAEPVKEVIEALAVKSHAIDQCLCPCKPKHAWPGVSRLRQRRHGTEFYKPKAQSGQPVHGLCMLVQPRRKTYGIGKIKTHRLNRQRRQGSAPCVGKILVNGMNTPEKSDGAEREAMGSLGLELEEQRSHQRVKTGHQNTSPLAR